MAPFRPVMRWEEPVTSHQTYEGFFLPLPLRPCTGYFLSESQLSHLQNGNRSYLGPWKDQMP